MAYNEESSASGHDEPWIQWFCGLKGHEFFCEVERSYIEDGFNLYGLRACVSNFSDCLDLILDRIGPDDSDDSHLTQSACTLYALIHARYIITAHGLDAMYNKYAAKEFGTCPLVQCGGQPVLPVGLKDEMGLESFKVFCPKCQSVYHPPPVRSRSVSHHGSSASSHPVTGGVDGAAFGTTFPHLFLMTFSNLVPDPLPADSSYIPRVFGFRVHKSAQQRSSGNTNSNSNPVAGNGLVVTAASTTVASESTSRVLQELRNDPAVAGATVEAIRLLQDDEGDAEGSAPHTPETPSQPEAQQETKERGSSSSKGGSRRRTKSPTEAPGDEVSSKRRSDGEGRRKPDDVDNGRSESSSKRRKTNSAPPV